MKTVSCSVAPAGRNDPYGKVTSHRILYTHEPRLESVWTGNRLASSNLAPSAAPQRVEMISCARERSSSSATRRSSRTPHKSAILRTTSARSRPDRCAGGHDLRPARRREGQFEELRV